MESKRWGILALCSIFLMSVAVLYAWSVFSAALENRQGWTRLETSGIFTLSMTAYCGGSLVSDFLARYWSTKKLLRSAAALLAAGFMIAGFWPAVGGVSLGYGVLCGCGVGITYNRMVSLCTQWFPDCPGLSCGILLACYSFATFPVSAAANTLLALFGWRRTMLLFGVFTGLSLLAGGVVLNSTGGATYMEKDQGPSGTDFLPGQMLRSIRFYQLFLWLIIMSACGLTVIGNTVPMATALSLRSETAALLPGIITMCGCAGRLGFGRLFDCMGQRRAAAANSGILVIAAGALLGAFHFDTAVLLIGGMVLLGISYSGMSSLCAASVRELFGTRHYSENILIMSLQVIVSSALGPLLCGITYTRWKSYELVCGGLLLLSLIGLLLAATMPGKICGRVNVQK